MELAYDRAANVAYIRFRKKPRKVTTISVSDELNVDIDADGRVTGIELLDANQQLSIGTKMPIVKVRRSGKRSRTRMTDRLFQPLCLSPSLQKKRGK